MKKRFTEEQIIKILRSRFRHFASRGLPETWSEHSIVLQMESKIRRHGGIWSSKIKVSRSWKCKTKASCCGPSARYPCLKRCRFKKVVSPATKRRCAKELTEKYPLSQRGIFRLIALHRSVGRYTTRRKSDEETKEQIKSVAHERPRFGYMRIT